MSLFCLSRRVLGERLFDVTKRPWQLLGRRWQALTWIYISFHVGLAIEFCIGRQAYNIMQACRGLLHITLTILIQTNGDCVTIACEKKGMHAPTSNSDICNINRRLRNRKLTFVILPTCGNFPIVAEKERMKKSGCYLHILGRLAIWNDRYIQLSIVVQSTSTCLAVIADKYREESPCCNCCVTSTQGKLWNLALAKIIKATRDCVAILAYHDSVPEASCGSYIVKPARWQWNVALLSIVLPTCYSLAITSYQHSVGATTSYTDIAKTLRQLWNITLTFLIVSNSICRPITI
mmetsp:Transcript_121781/g.192871  ORF Transcript_121781/g.192871 Transcript_121781/m.192871 type:complete len:292 (-) Transcript_121781:110-985(-)